jgi:hypothetical protein
MLSALFLSSDFVIQRRHEPRKNDTACVPPRSSEREPEVVVP